MYFLNGFTLHVWLLVQVFTSVGGCGTETISFFLFERPPWICLSPSKPARLMYEERTVAFEQEELPTLSCGAPPCSRLIFSFLIRVRFQNEIKCLIHS